MIRDALYKHLSENCDAISTWTHPVGKTNATKPYGVIKLSNTSRVTAAADIVFIELWPYFDKSDSSFVDVDECISNLYQIIANKVIFDRYGNRILIEWDNVGPDFFDEDRDALTRPVYLRTPKIR